MTLDALVELLDRYSDVYPLSPTGARGWVRGKRTMSNMEPEVWIEWDKDHWRYHGEADGWTFEHHFRLVDDSTPDIPDEQVTPPVEDKMNEILMEAQERVDDLRCPCPDCGEIHDDQQAFIDALTEAEESASGADGFIMLTLTPRPNGEMVVYEPELFFNYMNETARSMLEAQVVHLATQLFHLDVLDRVQDIEEGQ